MQPRSEPAVSTPDKKPGAGVSDVRARILAEHDKLRAAIAEVDRLAYAVAAEDVKQIDVLRTKAEKLYGMLSEHIDHEDTVLAPIIRRIDAWGVLRHEQMQRDHANQRTALAQGIRDLEVGGSALGQTVQSMCWEILHDMKREEHDLLHPDLWREDITIVEFGG